MCWAWQPMDECFKSRKRQARKEAVRVSKLAPPSDDLAAALLQHTVSGSITHTLLKSRLLRWFRLIPAARNSAFAALASDTIPQLAAGTAYSIHEHGAKAPGTRSNIIKTAKPLWLTTSLAAAVFDEAVDSQCLLVILQVCHVLS